MKVLLIVAAALLTPAALAYDEKYDSIDVDKILGDDDLFSAYINCMLDKGPCTVEHSADFRELLPEVVATSCAKCTPPQKEKMRKTVKALSAKRPEEFKEFRSKYDPKGEYEKDFAAFVLGTN